jgi:electron-transferring-flavoprotein dehydrogenase
MREVDVAVVGGGPAGSSAGRAAAARGADTLVFEKGVPRADRAEPGPDSTDAAGMLDYWVDIMDLPEPVPERVKLRELDGADFYGPTESCTLGTTGIDCSYPNFGFTFDRPRFDDWLRELAEDAGAAYRVGDGVRDVTVDQRGGHTLVLRSGEEVRAEYLILADGPQRTITGQVLDPILPDGSMERLAATRANHIAYQEHRRFPEELFDPSKIKFWWGLIPGYTAYPWVFPNDETICRVGLTMPIGVDLEEVSDRDSYPLLRPDDERVPQGAEYLSRLLEREYPGYDPEDFPLVEDRGKRGGTETYPISSTRPIDSPVGAKVAVAGGAMGTTSAFHEGGDHVAVRTGAIAGRLAAHGTLSAYNTEWKAAIGDEILRNVSLAEMARGYGPADWDRTFATARRLLASDGWTGGALGHALTTGFDAVKLVLDYRRTKYRFRDDYVQITEDEYDVARARSSRV